MNKSTQYYLPYSFLSVPFVYQYYSQWFILRGFDMMVGNDVTCRLLPLRLVLLMRALSVRLWMDK